MSSKFLHSFADENPELQRQIGCMTGIFQMFDRQLIPGRRINAHSSKKLTSVHAPINSGNFAAEHNAYSHNVLEKNLSKSSNENQRVSMESSRTSFSSSSCSSFSSLDCSKSTQQEPPSVDQNFYADRSPYYPPITKNYDPDAKPGRHELLSDPAYPPIPSGRLALDFRDVVKDSIYKDNHALSVRSSTIEDKKSHLTRYRDSPRPVQSSKSLDGSYATRIQGKSTLPDDLNDSLQVLAKLKEVPSYFSDSTEQPRMSYEAKDSSFFPIPKEAPRFSFDGRGSRPSLDFRDSGNPSFKLKELPRLSLDSREGSLRSSNLGSKSNSIFRDIDRSDANRKVTMPSDNKQDLGCNTRVSVVAKLMGLEVMPKLNLPCQEQLHLAENYRSKNFDFVSAHNDNHFNSNTYIITQDRKEDRLSCSPKSSLKVPIAPQQKLVDPVKKSISCSRIPMEVAPWRQQERIRVPQKTKFGYREAHVKQKTESVYSEIEKRLKEIEFQQSNKDLRALKQILGAIQAKGLLETERGEERPSESVFHDTSLRNCQNSRSASSRKVDTPPSPRYTKGSNISRALESPIVIMKPAKSLDRSGISPSSVLHLEDLSTLPKLRTSDLVVRKKTLVSSKMIKGPSVKTSSMDLTSQPILLKDKNCRKEGNAMHKARLRTLQGSSRLQEAPSENHGGSRTSTSPRSLELTRENNGSSVKNPNSLSPRLQQKRLEMEKRSRPPLPSAESNRSPKQQASRHTMESVSPRGRLKQKTSQAQQKDHQLDDNTIGTRSLSHQGDEASLRSDSNISWISKVDVEIRSADQSMEPNLPLLLQGTQSPGKAFSYAALMFSQKMGLRCSNENTSAKEPVAVAPEQPSPISVLDSSLYQDSLSPAKKTYPNAFRGDEIQTSVDLCESIIISPKFRSGFNHEKLERIENLVLKLSELSSINDETPATDHIAFLCETQNPDHRYVSEILLASGLLTKDLTSGPLCPKSIQLHPSGHPINPDLFLVLEQTKSGLLMKPEPLNGKPHRLKSDREKLQRKLIFDVVNELLIQKLDLSTPGLHRNLLLQARNARLPSGQCLLKELCSDIEQLKTESNAAESYEDDSTMTSSKDLLRQSENWTVFGNEMSIIVLEIERMIFKDLIDEVVISGEASLDSRAKASGRGRRLFAK